MGNNIQNYHWKAFAAHSESITHVNLNWVRISDPWWLAEAYYNSACALVDAAIEDVRQEDYFLPTAYLFRHSIELALKSIIRDACKLYGGKEPEKLLGAHKLRELWNEAKKHLVRLWGNDKSVLDPADAVIDEFAAVDNGGQAFRYHSCKDGSRPIEQLPEDISLENLKKYAGDFFEFLDGCHMGITACLDAQAEAPLDS